MMSVRKPSAVLLLLIIPLAVAASWALIANNNPRGSRVVSTAGLEPLGEQERSVLAELSESRSRSVVAGPESAVRTTTEKRGWITAVDEAGDAIQNLIVRTIDGASITFGPPNKRGSVSYELLEASKGGAARVLVTAAGYSEESLLIDHLGNHDVALFPEAVVCGSVTSYGDGAPVSDVRLMVITEDDQPLMYGWDVSAQSSLGAGIVSSKSDGSFSFSKLRAGQRYKLLVIDSVYTTGRHRGTQSVVAPASELNVYVGRVFGRLIRASCRPAASGTVNPIVIDQWSVRRNSGLQEARRGFKSERFRSLGLLSVGSSELDVAYIHLGGRDPQGLTVELGLDVLGYEPFTSEVPLLPAVDGELEPLDVYLEPLPGPRADLRIDFGDRYVGDGFTARFVYREVGQTAERSVKFSISAAATAHVIRGFPEGSYEWKIQKRDSALELPSRDAWGAVTVTSEVIASLDLERYPTSFIRLHAFDADANEVSTTCSIFGYESLERLVWRRSIRVGRDGVLFGPTNLEAIRISAPNSSTHPASGSPEVLDHPVFRTEAVFIDS